MATVSKEIADDIIAGKYPEDPLPVRIVKYRNAWGGESYGVEYMGQFGKYRESEYVQDPQTYWTNPNGLARYNKER